MRAGRNSRDPRAYRAGPRGSRRAGSALVVEAPVRDLLVAHFSGPPVALAVDLLADRRRRRPGHRRRTAAPSGRACRRRGRRRGRHRDLSRVRGRSAPRTRPRRCRDPCGRHPGAVAGPLGPSLRPPPPARGLRPPRAVPGRRARLPRRGPDRPARCEVSASRRISRASSRRASSRFSRPFRPSSSSTARAIRAITTMAMISAVLIWTPSLAFSCAGVPGHPRAIRVPREAAGASTIATASSSSSSSEASSTPPGSIAHGVLDAVPARTGGPAFLAVIPSECKEQPPPDVVDHLVHGPRVRLLPAASPGVRRASRRPMARPRGPRGAPAAPGCRRPPKRTAE